MIQKSTLLTLLLTLLISTMGWSQITLTSQIGSSNDDAEEQGANGSSPGSMDLTSTDLELVNDGNDGDQYVGMRFTGINIPQGAYISKAYIQFTVDETDSDSTSVYIKIEDVLNGTAFSGTAYDISNRDIMPDSILWEDIPAWNTTGAAGVDQATPDLSSLVQLMVNQSGWSSGNSINFIMTGIGTRTAESYDGSAGDAPILTIEYYLPTTVSIQIGASSDDAEEQGANGSSPGSMDLTSSDLELVRDGNDGDQWVGMRFANLAIPQGSFVVSSYIQFTVDEDDTITGDKHIWVEDVDNGTTFSGSSFNISSRDVTGDSVVWTNIPDWPTTGLAGPDQRTPDLSSLVQATLNRSGWSSGNAINILMNGTGERVAESYDGSAADAPVLVISYLPVTQATSQVASSSDDAEEQGANGSSPGTMDLTSSDLELVRDGNDGDQWVGMRFNSLNIPQGAVISHAYIQFTVDEVDTINGDKFIYAEDVDNSTTFLGTNSNISSRTLTNESVTWSNIPDWPTTGVAGPDQQTPNIATLVQSIVNRSGWSAGNSLNIIMNGTGQRVAESYDGSSGDAPKLIVSYAAGSAPLGSFPIDSGTIWAYNDSGYALASSWIDTNYNDTSWSFGPAQLGYGDGDEATVISYGSNANNKYPTYYFRQRFEAENVAQWDSLRLYLKYDDGAVVYLNGNEIYRVNMPTGTIGYTTLAASNIGGAQENIFTISMVENELVEGLNTIAVEVHQDDVTSSDITFDLRLEGVLPPLAVDTFPLSSGQDWYYLDNGTNQDTAWREFAFDPYAEDWKQGTAQLGYGDGDEVTVIEFGPNSGNKYITTYFYKDFYLDTTGLDDTLLIAVLRDDAAAVYLNGELVILDNMDSTYDYTTWATNIISGGEENVFNAFYVPIEKFNNGLNSVAVEIHQRDGTSSDKSFDLYIDVVPEPPVAGSGCTNGVLNHIGCFTSVDAIGQTQFLTIPESHAFQVIFQQGDAYDNFAGVAPGNHDFTGYVPINGSSTEGYVDVNHETTPGGVSVLDVHYDAANRVWITDSVNRVDMYTAALQSTTRNCSGGVTPWETSITSEETFNTGDANSDGYEDVGWNVEIDPATRTVVDDTKLWALGRMAHENVVVADDSVTVYQGEDGGSSCVFKFIADNPGDLSSGTLYVLKLDQPLVGGEPTGTTAQWIVVPNTTQSDRNNTRSLAQALGGTNFNGVEDCEIQPIDGQIYFTSKGHGRTYRFTDNGNSVSDFETFVGGQTYAINIGGTVINEPWAGGNDNLDFDDLGNLWVNQDGSDDYIWMVRPDHTQNNPKVELFASTPNGSESTGITFTPDHKFMFLSIQHPSGANGNFQDVTGNTFAFNKSTTIVVARKEYLGQYAPETQSIDAETDNAQNCESIDVNWTVGNGDKRLVIAKSGSAVDQWPVDGVWYNADAQFGAGDDLGGGNFVVYDSSATSSVVENLMTNTEFHFAVVEYNEQFGSVFYNVDNAATTTFQFDTVASETITGIDSSLIGGIETYNVAGNAGYDYNWSITGGNILAGQASPTISVEWTTIGNQTVAVSQTTNQGCNGDAINYAVIVSDSASDNDTISGILSTTGETVYSIYPNPTSGVTVVEFGNKPASSVALFDLGGSLVSSTTVTDQQRTQFDVSDLPAGVYVVRIRFADGAMVSQQLIVQ